MKIISNERYRKLEELEKDEYLESLFPTKNPYLRPPMNSEFNKLVNLLMDTFRLFVPYTEFQEKAKKNELGRVFGCRITHPTIKRR